MLQFRRIDFGCFPFSVKRERYLALVSEWLETKLANVYSLSSQQRLRDPLVPLHLTDRTEREVSTCPVTPTLPLHLAIYYIVRTKINNPLSRLLLVSDNFSSPDFFTITANYTAGSWSR